MTSLPVVYILAVRELFLFYPILARGTDGGYLLRQPLIALVVGLRMHTPHKDRQHHERKESKAADNTASNQALVGRRGRTRRQIDCVCQGNILTRLLQVTAESTVYVC